MGCRKLANGVKIVILKKIFEHGFIFPGSIYMYIDIMFNDIL